MTRAGFFTLLILPAFLLGGCVTTGGAGSAPSQTLFNKGLKRGYALMAEYENYIANDPAMATHFTEKAQSAAANENVAPDQPDSASYDAAALIAARGQLLGALEVMQDDQQLSALPIAEAQVNYDCWVARSARGNYEAASYCHTRFEEALAALKVTPVFTFAVPFMNDDAVPDAQALAMIRQAAASHEVHPDWRVHLTGNAARRGNKKNNAILAMRQAVSVRNYLAQNGVDPELVKIGAVESKGRDKDGVVDIRILPAYMDAPDQGPDVKTLAPHYFKGEEMAW